MNALIETDPAVAETALLNLVSFKWLMAGRGWRVDLSRLQRDAEYARTCAERGLDSGEPLLERRSAELLAGLTLNTFRASFTLSNSVHI